MKISGDSRGEGGVKEISYCRALRETQSRKKVIGFAECQGNVSTEKFATSFHNEV